MPTFGAEAGLSPVRYHIFKTPLAYPLGLELQNGVVQERLRRKRDGTGGKTDILFLLGECDCSRTAEPGARSQG